MDISDRAPAEYLPEYLARFSDSERQEMYYWHALPEGWEKMEYQVFLEERRKRIAQVIRDGYNTLLSNNEAKSSKWWQLKR